MEEINATSELKELFEISESLKNFVLKKIEEIEKKYESHINNLYEIRDCSSDDEGHSVTCMLRRYNFFSKLLKKILVNGVLIVKPKEQNETICLGTIFTATLVKVGKKEADKTETFILDGCDLSREGDRPKIVDYKTPFGVSFLGRKKGDSVKVKISGGREAEYVIEEIFFPW